MNDRLAAPPLTAEPLARSRPHFTAVAPALLHPSPLAQTPSAILFTAGEFASKHRRQSAVTMDFMNKAMTAVVVGVQTATGTDDGFGFTQNADGVFVRQRVEL